MTEPYRACPQTAAFTRDITSQWQTHAMNTENSFVRITLAAGERNQAVEAIDSHVEQLLLDTVEGDKFDAGALLEVRAQLCSRATCEMSITQAATLRTALEQRCDEIDGDLTEDGSEAWRARARRCLADVRLALVALRSALGEDVDAIVH